MEKKPSENRFFRVGDEDSDEGKSSRILTAVIIAILTVSVVIIGIVAASQRETLPPDDGSESQSESESEQESTLPGGSENVNPDTVPELLVPTAGAVSKAHDDSEPVFSNTMGDYRTHSGIDIAAAVGAPVLAVADGTVERVWEDPMMGTCVSLAMNGKAVAVYKNLGAVAEGITAGKVIEAGDVIGAVGESALLEIGDEAHIHFELEVDGKPKNPLDFFKKSEIDENLSSDSSTEE